MIGKTISHYKIVEKLGGGGMGVVYKARDLKLDRFVAIKFLPPQYSHDDESKERFINEAKSASALEHTNIATTHEIGETDDGQLFIVMAYYEGETLKNRIKRGNIEIADAIDFTIQIAKGLKKAHQQNIVHRDIKPANIIITKDNVVKIVDFGLAKFLNRANITKSGSTLGTVAYMSPEQALGKEVDKCSDLWSLGVVLYEMLTGRLPFQGDGDQAILYSIINEKYESLFETESVLQFGLINIIDKSLEKSPQKRYQKLDDMICDLELQAMYDNKPHKSYLEFVIKKIIDKRKTLYIITATFFILIITNTIYLINKESSTINSIAVLPFENISKNPELDYLCEGIPDHIRNSLSQLPELKVIARASVHRYQNQKIGTDIIAKELKIRAVLSGKLQQIGDKISIMTELIDTKENRLLWGQQYQQGQTEILDVPHQIINQITAQLQLELTSTQNENINKIFTNNTEAYQNYLRGLYQWNKFSLEGYHQAINYFKLALQDDPNYALAYIGLALSYTSLGSYHGNLSPEEAARESQAAIDKALELDENISDGYVALGSVKMFYDWDWESAEKAYIHAIELNPNSAFARQLYGVFLSIMGRTEEAIIQQKKSIELNPLTPKVYDDLGLTYLDMHVNKITEAIKQFKIAIDLDPQFYSAWKSLGIAYFLRDSLNNAINEFRRAVKLSKGHHRYLGILGWALGKSGYTDEAMEILYEIEQKQAFPAAFAIDIAKIYIGIGDNKKALSWLEKAYNRRSSGMILIKIDPYYTDLQSEPRFQELLRKMNFK